MRQSTCGETRTSVLGFGCGSVLGRTGRKASLRAMELAWDAGITLFDTARSYGNGEAEALLGEFLRDRRDHAVVATKYGIPPQSLTAIKRLALPVARMAIRAPGVRRFLPRTVQSKPRGTFSVAGLHDSVDTSLRQLRTDRIDVLFLHEATTEVLHQHDLLAALERLAKSGKVLRVGLYSDEQVATEAPLRCPSIFTAAQFGADPLNPTVAASLLRQRDECLVLLNHPFGSEERIARLRAILRSLSQDPAIPVDLREKIAGDDWQCLLEVLFGLALSRTAAHALLFSMMRPEHIQANVRAIEHSRFTAADLGLIRERVCEPSLVASQI